MKTYIPKVGEIDRRWILIDANGQRLGRLATRAATILRGKHRPIYTPFLDTGEFVVIINADKLEWTGSKVDQKTYFRHTTRPGSGRFTPLNTALVDKPEWVVRKAIWGMLPHGPLGRKMIRKLKVYRGNSHPHEAQQPVSVETI